VRITAAQIDLIGVALADVRRGRVIRAERRLGARLFKTVRQGLQRPTTADRHPARPLTVVS
jgi:hypothetical protein